MDGHAPYAQCRGRDHTQCRGRGRPDYRLCVCKLRAENNLAMSRQSDSESGTGGIECVTSGPTSSSSDLPPAPKRTKRAISGRRNGRSRARGGLHLSIVIFVALIFLLPLVVCMK